MSTTNAPDEGQEQAEEMMAVLCQLGFPEAIQENFTREKITPAVVPELTKAELEELGVNLLGDQKRLRAACNPPATGSAVIEEVRRVMGRSSQGGEAGPTSPRLDFNPNNLVHRGWKRSKGKLPVRGRPKKSRSNASNSKDTIVRNLSVLAYNDQMEKTFRTKDMCVVISGLVQLPLNADESHIREAIADVIHNSASDDIDCGEYGPHDFQFVKRCGHLFCIPDAARGFKFNMAALKTIAGQGHIYVRLTKDHSRQACSWSDDSDFTSSPPTVVSPDLSPLSSDTETNSPISNPTVNISTPRTARFGSSYSAAGSSSSTSRSSRSESSRTAGSSSSTSRQSSSTSRPSSSTSRHSSSTSRPSRSELSRTASSSSSTTSRPPRSDSSCLASSSAPRPPHSTFSRSTSTTTSRLSHSGSTHVNAHHLSTSAGTSHPPSGISTRPCYSSPSSIVEITSSPVELPSIITTEMPVMTPSMSVDLTADSSESLSPISQTYDIDHEQDFMSATDLYGMFSNYPEDTVDCVVETVGGDTSKAFRILLGGVTTPNILTEVSRSQLIGQRKTLVVSEDNFLSDTVAYYKSPSLDMSRPVSVVYEGMPGVDIGGVRRQLFTDVLKALKEQVPMFEGPEYRLLPIYSTSTQTSELHTILGRVIVHSLLLGGPGFPFLAPSVYWYVVSGSSEVAMEHITVADMTPPVAEVINKLVASENPEEIECVVDMPEFQRLQSETRSFKLPTVATKHSIAQEFLVHEALLRRQPSIDQLCTGLQSLGLLDVMKRLPTSFEPLFVYHEGGLTAEKLVRYLRFPCELSEEEKATSEMVKRFLSEATEEELRLLLRFSTGSEYIPPLGYTSQCITVRFRQQLDGITASTCTMVLNIPSHFDNYAIFKVALTAVITWDSGSFNTV